MNQSSGFDSQVEPPYCGRELDARGSKKQVGFRLHPQFFHLPYDDWADTMQEVLHCMRSCRHIDHPMQEVCTAWGFAEVLIFS